MTPRAALDHGLGEMNLALPESARQKLIAYLELLAKWNKTFNLTAIRDPLQMVSLHLLDSLSVARELPPGSLADIGSGAGLPGIPIAIAEPERPIVLLEANQKKGSFLRQAVIELGLANSAVQVERAETWRPIERFAVVISRAFADLLDFVASCRHLVADGGVLAAMKGALREDELARASSSCDCSDVRRVVVPLLNAERHVVLCRAKG
jgi:16S rRNA (guanine527-N7)-methyltransferase